eukprot:18888-Heterococcus_DN1.PRE.3
MQQQLALHCCSVIVHFLATRSVMVQFSLGDCAHACCHCTELAHWIRVRTAQARSSLATLH